MSTTAERARTALLVMDYQNAVFSHVPGTEVLVPRMAEVRRAAKAAGVMVVYVVVRFRSGYPEVSDRNFSFSAIRDRGGMVQGSPDAEIHPDLAPDADDIVVTKHRVGAFYGTDLDQILRSRDIETVVLAGIATSGVVLTTLRDAADRDFRIIVLSDLCGDRDEEVHRVLTTKVFAGQATVSDSATWVASLRG